MRPYNDGESLGNIIGAAVPGFVSADYPLFVEFIQAYLRFLEEKRVFTTSNVYPEYGTDANTAKTIQSTAKVGGTVYETRKFLEYRDIDTTLDEFTTHFLTMFAKNFPRYAYVPSSVLVRSLRQFYQSKGTEESIEWFFRAFFNKTATVYYPRMDILKASDGSWSEPITIKVSAGLNRPNPDVAEYYVGQRIVTDTGSAQVESCNTYVVGQEFNQYVVVNELTLKTGTILGAFYPNQSVRNTDSEVEVFTTILPVISDVIVNSGGSHYSIGDPVTFSQGPTLGEGYNAEGRVSAVSNTALNGVKVVDGGDGYTTGVPVTFTSTTGSGASAVVDSVVYGDFALEDGSGFVSAEIQNSDIPILVCLEDRNDLALDLLITSFVGVGVSIQLDVADYGAASGVTQLNGVKLDSPLEYALTAVNLKPFMHPWVFTGANTVELANASAVMTMTSNTYFANGATVFAISGPRDLTTTKLTANVAANVIVSDIYVGNGQDQLYLKGFTGLAKFTTNLLLKQDRGETQDGTVVLNGTANVVGNGTHFDTNVKPDTHLVFADGSQSVVKTVVNSTFLTCHANTTTAAANTFGIVPIGTVSSITLQGQRYYGKIKTVRMLTVGAHYEAPPSVRADSMSARAQELAYLDGASVVPANGQIRTYTEANLTAQQDSGQVTRVEVTNSGVNYTDANSVFISAAHSNGAVGDNATFTPVLGSLTKYAGRYLDTRGFLSADKYLQDDVIYNDYTYAVRVDETFDRYKDLLHKILHPAGFSLLDPDLEPLKSRL